MRKLLMALSLSVGTLCQFSAYGHDGIINFIGEITNDSCQVIASSQNRQVLLDKVSADGFSNKINIPSAPKAFNIDVTGCPENSGVSIKFNGTPNEPGSNLLANQTGSDYATGVAVGIYEQDGTLVKLNEEKEFPIVKGDGRMTFNAAYVATKNQVNAGKVSATTTFILIYN